MKEHFNPYDNYTSTSVFYKETEQTLTSWTRGYFKHNILPHLPADKAARILEVGCGYGRYIKILGELGYKDVLGIDISEQQVAYAREQFHLDNVMVKDAIDFLQENLATYDVVLLLDVMEHLEIDYSVRLIKLIHGALKQKGTLLIQVPNGLAPLAPFRYQDITHIRAYTPRSMTQSLLYGGFSPSAIKHYELPPHAHGLKSTARRFLWFCLLKPAIAGFALAAYGDTMGAIYTVNMLTVATR